MYHVEVKNCNSILTGNIKVEEGKLNIKPKLFTEQYLKR